MDETISVIIPLYNKEKEIKRAIDSVLAQTYQDFEIIVVDDHSSDNSLKIVRKYCDPRIIVVEQEHHGVSYTRNHGVDLAIGNHIAFLDADDEWKPKHLETIKRLYDKYPDAGIYCTAYEIQTPDGKTHLANIQNIPNPPWEGLIQDYFKSGAYGHQPVNSTTAVIPKQIFIEMGGFPVGCGWTEDADLFGRIALKYPVAFSWKFGAVYHWDAQNRMCNEINTSRTLNFDDEPFIHYALEALEKQEVPVEFIESLNEYIAIRQIGWACRYISAGRYDDAQALLNQCKTRWFFKEKIKLLLKFKIRLLFLDLEGVFLEHCPENIKFYFKDK